MEKKGVKVVTDLLTKTVGLLFFSLLAIGLGVLFGVLFEGMLRENPDDTALVESNDSVLQTVTFTEDFDLSAAADEEAQPVQGTSQSASAIGVVSKVLVGPFNSYQEAAAAGAQLQSEGYPTYILSKVPYAVQVGAFSNATNAENLKAELIAKGYEAFLKVE
ncbi:MAG TPA: hypothetical protein DER58_01610 [Firmicutes bacterium]|nr:hypothetical protein [Bacillota bacterium]HCF91168.1 hypothetical protein [Bacillota bacterium]